MERRKDEGEGMKWCCVMVFVSRSKAEIDISRTHLYFLYVCLGEEATAATEAETDYEVFLIFRRRMRTAEEEKKSPRPQQMFKWETEILYV